MANLKVTVMKQVRVGGLWKRCPVYVNPKNHKVENDKVLVKGVPEHHPEGEFGLWYYQNGKRQWRKISPTYDVAKRAAESQELALKVAADPSLQGKVVMKGDKTPIRAAIDLFLEDYTHAKDQKMSYDLNEFADWVNKDYMEDLTKSDIKRFFAHVKTTPENARPNQPHKSLKIRSERTASNKCAAVNSFYRAHFKLKPGEGLVTGKDIKFTQKSVRTYNAEELGKFFGHCTPEQHLMYTVFLQAGLRKQEVMHMEWEDIDATNRVIRVREKVRGKLRAYSFSPKTGEERDVSVPGELIERLLEAKKTSQFRLVFPTRTGRPNDKIWDQCTRIAMNAGFPEGRFQVHQFRATFASHCLQEGMDLKTVQQQLGHSNIESTMRYLDGKKGKDLQNKVSAIWSRQPEVVLPDIARQIVEG